MTRLSRQVSIDRKLPAHLGTPQVEFSWPREVSNGKWLLYLTEVEVMGASEPRCAPPGDIVNPLNLTVTMATSTSL